MSALCFVDTNVLVYSRDASEPDKQPRAHEWLTALWRHRCGRTSIQVLNEYYVTVTRKLKPGLSEEEAWKDIDDLWAWQPATLSTRFATGRTRFWRPSAKYEERWAERKLEGLQALRSHAAQPPPSVSSMAKTADVSTKTLMKLRALSGNRHDAWIGRLGQT